MKVFCTGAAGYIGGSVAAALIASGHEVSGLVRSESSAQSVKTLGIEPIFGSLDDVEVLADAAARSDVVISAANADHERSADALLQALEGSGKTFIHTSGSSIVGTQSAGERVDAIYDEETPFNPSPGRAARVALNEFILSSRTKGLRPIIICPSLIYGVGRGPAKHSMQVPWLIALARERGGARHYGPGENIWSNVHIDDLVELYRLALASAPAGAFYFAENGEDSMKEVCEAINRTLGIDKAPIAMSLTEAAREWGESAAQNTMGSNSRVRAVRARNELKWTPKSPALIDEIEHGCYTSMISESNH
ncbi:NAD-dependent epimerase/dehydratase family protein [Bradyrhizobium sp. LHD-71]|uniref:NAD-dependent epimerase/dehydratase family protein n=1 Tax=Bradyrhizobium sp. LHD-71 TaxID=3072141 RepID=UPI00280F10FD|nr:NAD-dependent epimerase/dehydratase family protein [Bradyrhizobium sp. LHD-71]MDQ8732151.1 NAD-dependent epimerase/dehydratase family protein [Bradyrhizobium sp. LHD-71]